LSQLIPNDTIDHIRSSTNIVDVISDCIALKKAGKNLMGLCPFHADTKPSFVVSEAKQIFHCFGCGKGGNVITFLMEYNGLTFPEAIKLLAQKCGAHIPTQDLSRAEKRVFEKREQILKANKDASVYFQNSLQQLSYRKRPFDYLLSRGLTSATIQRFGIGYAPDKWDGLLNYFTKKGIAIDIVKSAGLLNSKGSRFYDVFHDRIMFPIMNTLNQIVGFGGCAIGDATPKYLNSPETMVYNKRRILYGLNAARQYIRKNDKVFIVEGYFDLLSMYHHGIKNVVATLGTALTLQHIRALRGYTRSVTLIFDSDSAGRKAVERALIPLLEEGIEASVLPLPNGDDPDSYISREGVIEFAKSASKGTIDIVSFVIAVIADRYGPSAKGRIKTIDAIVKQLLGLSDSVRRCVYAKEVAVQLQVDESAIAERLQSPTIPSSKVSIPRSAVPQNGSLLEEAFIAALLQCPVAAKDLNIDILIKTIESDELKKLGHAIISWMTTDKPDSASLITRIDDDYSKKVAASLALRSAEWDQISCCKIIGQYQRHCNRKHTKKISNQIRAAEQSNDTALLDKLLAKKQSLNHCTIGAIK
jgi:DNA primase